MATTKQRRALAKIVENGGNVPKAMREVGYRHVKTYSQLAQYDDGYFVLSNMRAGYLFDYARFERDRPHALTAGAMEAVKADAHWP